jgi:hypothetical protein
VSGPTDRLTAAWSPGRVRTRIDSAGLLASCVLACFPDDDRVVTDQSWPGDATHSGPAAACAAACSLQPADPMLCHELFPAPHHDLGAIQSTQAFKLLRLPSPQPIIGPQAHQCLMQARGQSVRWAAAGLTPGPSLGPGRVARLPTIVTDFEPAPKTEAFSGALCRLSTGYYRCGQMVRASRIPCWPGGSRRQRRVCFPATRQHQADGGQRNANLGSTRRARLSGRPSGEPRCDAWRANHARTQPSRACDSSMSGWHRQQLCWAEN